MATSKKAAPPMLIIPPAELRPLIEKTAEYVAKNGSQFEEIIYNNEKGNPLFSFLKLTDPYRAYYDKKVVELAKVFIGMAPNEEGQATQVLAEYRSRQAQNQAEQSAEPADSFNDLTYHFAYPKPHMSLTEAELVRLTAFYVAMSGEDFLDAVTLTEYESPLFQFLRPNHRLFHYFTNLVDSYLAIRTLAPEQFSQLHENTQSRESILQRCSRRVEHEKQEFKEKRRLVEETNKMAETADHDWNNFVIVDTIDLETDTSLRQAKNPKELGESTRPFLGARKTINPEFAFLVDGLHASKRAKLESFYSQDQEELSQAAIRPEQPVQTISFKPNIDKDAFYKCTFCNQNIPLSLFEEHNKQELKLQDQGKAGVKEGRTGPAKTFGHLDISGSIQNLMDKRASLLAEPTGEQPQTGGSLSEFRHQSVPKPAFLNRK